MEHDNSANGDGNGGDGVGDTVPFTVRMNPELRDTVRDLARILKVPQSVLICHLVRCGLDHESDRLSALCQERQVEL